MSSPASRQRQRHRRRARERLWSVQKELAERQVDLVSYVRVLADMERRYQEPAPLVSMQALAIVAVCRNQIRNDCERLLKAVEDQKQRVEDLEPKQEPTQETQA